MDTEIFQTMLPSDLSAGFKNAHRQEFRGAKRLKATHNRSHPHQTAGNIPERHKTSRNMQRQNIDGLSTDEGETWSLMHTDKDNDEEVRHVEGKQATDSNPDRL